ncbi:Uncharacterised protein [Klebsiella pneumoniae]|nr:Uncharacterised protein [Klebsiella pneumoniae]
MGQTHLFHPVAKQVFHPLNERLQRFFGFFGGLVYFIRQLVQRLVGFSDRLERFAVELGQVAHHPLVDAIGEQQHFDPFLTQQLEVRAALRRRIAVGCDVVDLLLTFFHA